MTGVEGLVLFIIDLAVLIVILICCLAILPYLKLLIWREIGVPEVEIKSEYVSIVNILSLAVIYFRFGEMIAYGSYFPALRESVSFTAPVLFFKITATVISMLLIIIVESFAFSLFLHSLKRYASYSTVLWIVSLVNIPTIFFVLLRIFDINLGLYSRSGFMENVHFW